MNKQPKPIDEDKLLEWIRLEQEKEFPEGLVQYIDGRKTLLEILELRLKQGRFTPDHIPLPTIKPGDEVSIVKGPFAGRKVIVNVNHAHKRNISTTIDGEPWNIHYDDLEVSHD